jgi:uncharacterized protein (TIGR00297 family)
MTRASTQATPTPFVSTKAIPPARDRLQSKILVWIVVPILCYLTFTEFKILLQMLSLEHGLLSLLDMMRGYFIASQGRYDNHVAQIIAVSVIFALAAWRLRAATVMAAACGGLICLLISTNLTAGYGTSVFHSGLTCLSLLFVLTFYATRLGREQQALAGLSESRRERNAAQVIANLGIAAFFASTAGWYIIAKCGWFGEFMGEKATARIYFAIPYMPMLAALAEAAADTVSSEIGQAVGGTPFLLTTLRRVPPGTDGAISLYGTLAGIAAAAIIAATGAPALGMSAAECAVVFAAGIVGLFFDSLLGATVERKGWIGNDLVNFTSTAFAATVALFAIRFVQNDLLR